MKKSSLISNGGGFAVQDFMNCMVTTYGYKIYGYIPKVGTKTAYRGF